MTRILAPISVGEIFDKITILRIKTERIESQQGRDNVHRELTALELIVDQAGIHSVAIDQLVDELQSINAKLWDIEDGKRRCEAENSFDQSFIELARAVYIENDRRASVKRQINHLSGSEIVEEKSHTKNYLTVIDS